MQWSPCLTVPSCRPVRDRSFSLEEGLVNSNLGKWLPDRGPMDFTKSGLESRKERR